MFSILNSLLNKKMPPENNEIKLWGLIKWKQGANLIVEEK
jgi:hypothetical protein